MGELKDTTSDLFMKTATRPNVKMAYFILFFSYYTYLAFFDINQLYSSVFILERL